MMSSSKFWIIYVTAAAVYHSSANIMKTMSARVFVSILKLSYYMSQKEA